MRTMKKRILTTLLAALMLLTLAACNSAVPSATPTPGGSSETPSGGQSENPSSDPAEPLEVKRITLYPQAANLNSGVVGGFKGEYFASLGFEVDVWAYSDERTNAILSSGDMPDIMYVATTNLDVMIENNMLLKLDDYLSSMPKLQSYDPIEPALNYVREFRSAGTGNLYCLPLSVGQNSTKYAYFNSTERNAVNLRWDVYEEIGSPEINSVWDLLDVMDLMLKQRPADEDGTPYYGTVLNNGSDTEYWACMVMFYRWQGYMENQLPYLLESNMVAGTYDSILSTDSLYYQGLKWYNEAYRRGLLDPDSINNDRATQKPKVDRGYAMIPSGYLPGWAPNYLEYYIPGTNIYYNAESAFGAANAVIAVNAKTENVDACLAFLDMLADPMAHLIIRGGPDGGLWYTTDDGKALITEAGQAYLDANGTIADFALESGEVVTLWNTGHIVNTGELIPYTDSEGNARFCSLGWTEIEEAKAQHENFLNWQKTTGYTNFQEWLAQENAFYPTSSLDNILNFCSVPDDIMQFTVDAIRDVVVNASWQMVYADSDADFDSIWNKMLSDCEGLGAQSIIDWRLADIENARAIRDSLLK